MDEEYKRQFPEPIVRARSNIKKRLEEAKADATTFSKAERAYSELESHGAASVEHNKRAGSIELTAWISSPDISAVDTLLKEFNGELKWDNEEELYKLEASIWWW